MVPAWNGLGVLQEAEDQVRLTAPDAVGRLTEPQDVLVQRPAEQAPEQHLVAVAHPRLGPRAGPAATTRTRWSLRSVKPRPRVRRKQSPSDSATGSGTPRA